MRDNIHSRDLVRAFLVFHEQPKAGAVCNIGGRRTSNCSMIEAIGLCEQIAERQLRWTLSETPRLGDHRRWISDNDEFRREYPEWGLDYGVEEILRDIFEQNFEHWTVTT